MLEMHQTDQAQHGLSPTSAAPAGAGVGTQHISAPTLERSAYACDACPVCSVDLSMVSHTAAGRAAHVNACLDVSEAAAVVGHAPARGAAAVHGGVLGSLQSGNAAAAAAAAAEAATEGDATDGVDLCDEDLCDDADCSIQQWLQGIGAGEAAAAFMEAELDPSVLPHLNDHDLQELGLADNELRDRILQAAAAGVAAGGPDEQEAGGEKPWQQQQQWELEEQEHDLWPGAPGAAGDPAVFSSQQQLDFVDDDGCWEDDEWRHDDASAWGPGQPQPALLPAAAAAHEAGAAAQAEGWGLQVGAQEPPASPSHQQPAWQQAPPELQQQWQAGAGQAAGHQPHQPHHHQQQQQAWQHQAQQQQQQLPGRQRPLQQQPLNSAGGATGPQGGGAGHASPGPGGSGQQQTSITGYTRQQQQQQQQQQSSHAGAKEAWRALFRQPRQPLGAVAPAAPPPARQMVLTRQGGLAAPPAAGLGAVRRRAPVGTAAAAAGGGAAAAAGAPAPLLLTVKSRDLPSWWPAWRRLPGTNIIVDCFGPRPTAALAGTGPHTWVLTHFHADHYMGLGRRFAGGTIICTPITAALVALKLRVAPERLLVLELGQEVTVEGTRLQLVDANHCPGAAMVVARPPGGAPPVLHTGDARLSAPATRGEPLLAGLVGRCVLVLDTTYADAAYCFPPQQEVLDWVLRAVKAELFNPRSLFLFGSYTIGKERLFLHVAAALGRRVYVGAAKRAIMACLRLEPALAALLTTNHLEANIHVVPMRQVTPEAMEALLLRYKGRYTSVVGFKPTGWTHAGSSGGGGNQAAAAAVAAPSRSSLSIKPSRRHTQRGTVVLYNVPYSEHSSCAELCEFVAWLRPLSIIPSVNNDGGPKLRSMLEVLAAGSRPVRGPMDAFCARRQAQQQQQLQEQQVQQEEEQEQQRQQGS